MERTVIHILSIPNFLAAQPEETKPAVNEMAMQEKIASLVLKVDGLKETRAAPNQKDNDVAMAQRQARF